MVQARAQIYLLPIGALMTKQEHHRRVSPHVPTALQVHWYFRGRRFHTSLAGFAWAKRKGYTWA